MVIVRLPDTCDSCVISEIMSEQISINVMCVNQFIHCRTLVAGVKKDLDLNI